MGETTTRKDEVVVFLDDVRREGLITDFTAESLLNYRARQTRPVGSQLQTHPAFEPANRLERQPASTPPTRPAVVPTPPTMPAFAPASPQRPSRTEIWARYARKRSKKMWGTLSADFAANALTYLGVLLAVVVIFVFFAFGYFSDFIDAEHKELRPLAEVGVVAFFLGLAWVLRHRTGIPQTSAAVEMIGILLIPVMMSASFRDGCTPAYRVWCLPPDADGPARWAAYGLVGLISAAIYYVYARRRHVYSYLVGPMLWVAVGAFALYLDDGIRLVRHGDGLELARFTSDGISAPQLIAVLAAIGISIAVATRLRSSRIGSVIAVPTVRSGVLVVPLILLMSVVFAYNDALASGVANPGLADLAWPNVMATAIGAAVFAAASRTGFAWADLSQRLRIEVSSVLRIAAYLSLAASWLFTAGFGVSVGWLGAGLVAYALVVAGIDRFSGSSQTVWLVRVAGLAGAALALVEPGSATLAWGAICGLMVMRVLNPAAASVMARYVPRAERDVERQVQLGAIVLVTIGAGPARLFWPEASSIVLLLAGSLLTLTRFTSNREIRSLAGIPATVLAVGAFGAEVWRQAFLATWDAYQFSVFVAAVAAALAATTIRGSVRLAAGTSLWAVAAGVALREYFGSGLWPSTWTDTAVLGVFGLALIGSTFGRMPAARFTAALGHLFVGAAVVRSLPYEETAILGIAVGMVAYALEAFRIERGARSIFSDIDWLPALVSLTSIGPLAVLIARQSAFFAEGPRFGPLLAGLAWIYLAAAAPKHPRVRLSAIPLAYGSALVSLLLSVPSVTAMLIATLAASVLTATIGVAAERPLLTIPSWFLAAGAVVLAASRMGVDEAHLHLALHLAALVMVVGAASLSRTRWSVSAMGVGAVLLPVAIAASDGSWTAWLALSAAGAYAWLGWSTRIGLFSVPTAVVTAIGYVAILNGNGWAGPSDDPVLWMPLAALLIAATVALPGNRAWRVVADPAPGLLLTGLAIGGIALADAARTDIALVCVAMLLIESYVVRRSEIWLGGAAVALVVAGLLAGGFWAPLATGSLSVVLAYLADRHRLVEGAPVLRSLAMLGIAATHGLVATWLHWNSHQLIIAITAMAGPLLAAVLAAELRTSLTSRVRAWRTQVFWLSQFGALVVIGTAAAELSASGGAGVVAAVAGFEAIVAAVLGSVSRSAQINVGSALIASAAYSQLPIWLGWDHNEIMGATGVIALALAMVATMATRAQDESPVLKSWTGALHGLVGGAALAVLVIAIAPEAADQDFWMATGVLLGLGVHLSANAWAAPAGWQVRAVAIGAFLGGTACGMVAAEGGAGPAFETSLIAAGVGLVVAIIAGTLSDTDSIWRRELAVLSAGLEVLALGGLIQHAGPLTTEVGLVLVVVGAALAAYGILARRLEVVEAAIAAWLGALLILVNDQIGMSLHVLVLIASVALLGVLELERVRHEIDEVPHPAWVDHVEWILMLAAPILAAAEMFGALWFGFVLFAEGLALAGWGTARQVRRRAVTGVCVMASAILLVVAIPAIHGLMVGLAAGTWLAIGAAAAVLLIVAGSAIERQRHAIGRRLSHIGEILEQWD